MWLGTSAHRNLPNTCGAPKSLVQEDKCKVFGFEDAVETLRGLREVPPCATTAKLGVLRDHIGEGPVLLLVFFLPKNPADGVMYARNQPFSVRTFHHFTLSIRCLFTTMDLFNIAFGCNNLSSFWRNIDRDRIYCIENTMAADLWVWFYSTVELIFRHLFITYCGSQIRPLYLRCSRPALHFQKSVVVDVRDRAVDWLPKHRWLSLEGWSKNYQGNFGNWHQW